MAYRCAGKAREQAEHGKQGEQRQILPAETAKGGEKQGVSLKQPQAVAPMLPPWRGDRTSFCVQKHTAEHEKKQQTSEQRRRGQHMQADRRQSACGGAQQHGTAGVSAPNGDASEKKAGNQREK